LGRAFTKDEVRYVQQMARRIAAVLLLQPALDANYESVKQHTFPCSQVLDPFVVMGVLTFP